MKLIATQTHAPAFLQTKGYLLLKAIRTDTGPGLAMNCAIIDDIVQSQGGKILAESRRGHGSTFRVRLPLGEQHG